ncbi:MAG: glycosyl hydrolase [Sphingobacteriaceae bacterium]|nr:glycosyl hydrolase [Sphingobacteriaceae bacterium]
MEKGWVSLFDGKTLSGWHSYGQTTASPMWKVEDGAIHLDPTVKSTASAGLSNDLVTDKEYGNYHLKLDWKISPKGNSGIIFYVHEDPAKYKQSYYTGLEMQVLDNEGHADGKITKHRAGDLYDLVKSSTEPVKSVGQWNTAEIISNNGTLQLFMNGVKVVETHLWDDNWKQMVANSKFKAWGDFGTFKTGKIALQNHGDDVWFKNIMIKQL